MNFSQKLVPDKSGFIKDWLVCGPKEELYKTDYFNPNQLEFEKKIREIIADKSLKMPPEAALDAECLGTKWEYYIAGNNYFVDFSKFYFLLTKVEMYAATVVCSPVKRKLDARLWTFEAVEVWVNKKLCASIDEPVYKPIKYIDLTLDLEEGENEIFVRCQNLGVRDTRNLFGLQLRGDFEDIYIQTPDFDKVKPLAYAQKELMEISIKDGRLIKAPSFPVDVNGKTVWNGGELSVDEDTQIVLTAEINGKKISREIENSRLVKPIYSNASTLEEHRRILASILHHNQSQSVDTAEDALDKVNGDIINNCFGEHDYEKIRISLVPIKDRADCADFVLMPLMIIVDKVKEKLPQDLLDEIKNAALNFRYWMDENGSDGMCFWSENHAIGFYTCQLLAGKNYPHDTFTRSQRTGEEQYKIANERCREWFDSIEETAFEEFLSPGYMNVTLTALMALYSYADKDVSKRAKNTADRIFRMLCTHFFDGSLVAPNGRIYSDVIRPFMQSIQSTISFFSKDIPLGKGGDMINTYLLSDYQAPEDLQEIMNAPADKVYQTGNAQVSIYKQNDYILTSVASERGEDFKGGWDGDRYRKENPYETGNFSFMYVKALNEKFHGTTLFQPGVYGYQQHMWSAALSNECVVFANHPGSPDHFTKMRPGYWYGNGLMPALHQWKNTLLAIYVLDDCHPVDFTHLYFPHHTFDRVEKSGNWIFGQKKNGMVGIWCSGELQPHNEYMIDCEYRVYSRNHAYMCVCSDEETEGGFDKFCQRCLEINVVYDEDRRILDDGCGHSIKYIKKYNASQVI